MCNHKNTNVEKATCAVAKICTDCQAVLENQLEHEYGTIEACYPIENNSSQHTVVRVCRPECKVEAKYELGDHRFNKDGMCIDCFYQKPKDSFASDWAVAELKIAKERGLIPDEMQNADLRKNITRAEFAEIAVRLVDQMYGNKVIEKEIENPFIDTNNKYVIRAYRLGITNGKTPTRFDPNGLVTREEMAAMVVRAMQAGLPDKKIDLNEVDNRFADDNQISSWAKENVYFLVEIGVISGTGDNKFSPKNKSTREQALVIAARTIQMFQ